MIHNEILINMLKSANLTKSGCSKLLNTHKNSLDSYIYKFNPSGDIDKDMKHITSYFSKFNGKFPENGLNH